MAVRGEQQKSEMDYDDFRIALITALPTELACVQSLLDERYPDLPRKQRDRNTYIYGRIGKHNVVLACLPSGVTGNTSVAVVAERVWNFFPKLEFGLMVGIGGGMPAGFQTDVGAVRLGDVVVGKPTETFGGVVKFDLGRTVPSGSEEGFVRTGMLNRPPDVLLTAVSKLQAKNMLHGSDIPRYLREMGTKYPEMRHAFVYPGVESDVLFEYFYEHESAGPNCKGCSKIWHMKRDPRNSTDPVVHYGTILSGDVVMRRATTRDNLRRDFNALCVEMEAAGINSSFPCIVIRGICDYADSHKNKDWQPYAAAVAAAYAKELLEAISPAERDNKYSKAPQKQTAQDHQSGSSSTFNVYGGIHSSGGKQIVGGTYNGPVYFN